ncbi:MAG: DUF805 domain-containing protein, partial [Nocardioidaceae bacterium]
MFTEPWRTRDRRGFPTPPRPRIPQGRLPGASLMTFTQAVRSVLSKYATFSGRATRSEYWWFYLFSVLVSLATSVVDAV